MSSYKTRNRKLKKKKKRAKKLKTQHYGFFSSKNELGNAEKEKK